MQKIEMEVFEAAKFLELAAEAETIRLNSTQLHFLRTNWAISSKLWVDGDSWMIFDADIVIEEPVDDSSPRNIVFEMFDPAPVDKLPFIFHKQSNVHNPPHETGNCMQTVIASLLGKQIHEVPHFGAGLTFDRANPTVRQQEADEFMARVHAYLKSINYRLFEVMYDSDWEAVKQTMSAQVETPMIISGESKKGTNHCVIFYNGEIYDPHPANSGLTGPMDNGYYAVGVLVKIPGYFAKEI